MLHAAWQAPDKRFGLVLANWTGQEQEVAVDDPRLGPEVRQHVSAEGLETKTLVVDAGRLSVKLPPLSGVLLDATTNLEVNQ